MSRYFQYFPKTFHSGEKLTDITKRVKFYQRLQKDPYIFLPYTIKEDERADEIAYYYYGDSGFIWLVYLSNNIIDPYYEWPLNTSEFDDMLIKKYTTLSGTTGLNVVNWTRNTNITTNILYYKNVADPEIQISPDSYGKSIQYDGDFVTSDWYPYRYYDYEFDQNEERRTILLVSRIYASQIEREFKRVMNE